MPRAAAVIEMGGYSFGHTKIVYMYLYRHDIEASRYILVISRQKGQPKYHNYKANYRDENNSWPLAKIHS